ncbi:hypothetical protein M513_12333 [Trichuris suis]|uniref:Uncharacterized protein n=1 Tax=Trichuris suis TaxID=68888 RepID=A0A085LPA9_9BILA|nr:hypothetical protein M513_12333 [Trichuris suis]
MKNQTSRHMETFNTLASEHVTNIVLGRRLATFVESGKTSITSFDTQQTARDVHYYAVLNITALPSSASLVPYVSYRQGWDRYLLVRSGAFLDESGCLFLDLKGLLSLQQTLRPARLSDRWCLSFAHLSIRLVCRWYPLKREGVHLPWPIGSQLTAVPIRLGEAVLSNTNAA